MDDRTSFFEASFESFPSVLSKNGYSGFDIVLCNPPYLSERRYSSFTNAIFDRQPTKGFVGGVTGHEAYAEIVLSLLSIDSLLSPTARIIFEVRKGAEENVKAVVEECSKGTLEFEGFLLDYKGYQRGLQFKLVRGENDL